MDDDDSLTTVETTRQGPAGPDPRDDWLGTGDNLDWFSEEGEEHRAPPRRRGPVPVRFGSGRAGFELDPEIRRRRLVAAAVLVAIVVIAVVLGLVAFGGGGGSPYVPASPIVTVPVKTTPAKAATTPSRTGAATGALKIVLPAAGPLAFGDTGSTVKTLQRALAKLGSTGLAADGDFGAQTQQAVEAFQQAHGLVVDGVVGAKTASALNAALAKAG